jgi:hypothetical protein
MNRFAEAIQQARVDVVPRVMVGGGENGASGNVMEGLLTMLLSEKMGETLNRETPREANPETDRLREEIRRSMMENPKPDQGTAPAEEAKS